MAERLRADDEISLPMARHRSVFHFCRAFADEDFRSDKRLAPPSRPRPWHSQCPARTEAGSQLAFQRTPALDVEGLVNGLVADTHGAVVREIDPQAFGDLLRAPRHSPTTALPSPMSSTFPRHDRPRRCKPARRRHQQACPAHTFAALGWRPASLVSVDRLPVRRVTAQCSPSNPDCHHASPHCAATPATPSTPTAPIDAQLPYTLALAPAKARSPPVPQRQDSARTTTSTSAPGATAPSRPPAGTIGCRPVLKPAVISPRPRSTDLRRSKLKIAAGDLAAPLGGRPGDFSLRRKARSERRRPAIGVQKG